MNSEQKAELAHQVEQLSQSFQDAYDADLDFLTRRDKAHVTRIAELEAENAKLRGELAAARWQPVAVGMAFHERERFYEEGFGDMVESIAFAEIRHDGKTLAIGSMPQEDEIEVELPPHIRLCRLVPPAAGGEVTT